MSLDCRKPKGLFLVNTAENTRSGFTLIELLVVISIISLLVSILLPALSGARDAAKTILCASRMRTIGLAGQMYIADNSRRLPYAYDWSPTEKEGRGPWCWPGAWAGQYMDLDRYSRISVGSGLWQSMAEANFSCPARGNHPVVPSYDVFSYGMNIHCGMLWWGYPMRKENDVKTPSAAVMLVDVEGIWPPNAGAGDGARFYLTGPGGWDESYAYRHRNLLNVLFLDGHVTTAGKNKTDKLVWEF